MKNLKKVLSVVLVVIMLLSSAPLQGLTDIELPQLFSTKAEALNVNYCQTAAAEWAKAHVYDYNSVLYNKGYWNDGGDCANFVSQCLYMGGLDMNSFWNISGYYAHWAEKEGYTYAGSYVRCQQLYNYLVKLGAEVIKNPKASQVSIGDVILYSREGASRMTHTAIVIDIKNGEPVVAAHSTGTVMYRSDEPYRDWHLGFKPERTYLMKLHGTTCVNYNAKNFDVYVATGSNTRLYNSKSTSSGYSSTFITGANPDYAHVYKVENGWGYTYRYNNWGWIKLSNFTYSGHWESPAVDHLFGEWTAVKVADCKNDGLDKRTCTRCGYEETRTTKGGHIVDPTATCLSAGFCKVCKERVEEPLGHDWDKGTITTQPTCTETGIKTFVCKRDSSHKYTEVVAALGHNYEATPTSPTCVDNGEDIMTCTRCDDSYVEAFNEEDAWTDWTTDTVLLNQLPSDRIQTKTQYAYRNREYTTSTASSLSGWDLDKKERISWGATQGPVSSDPSNGSRNVWSETVYDHTEYHYYRWTNGSESYTYEKTGYWLEEKWFTYILPTSKFGTSIGYVGTDVGKNVWARADYEGNRSVDKTFEKSVNRTDWYYQEPVYKYYYSRWPSKYSEWQDAYVEKTDTRDVKTRTLYKYNLSALGHDFNDTNDKEYINTNKFNAPDPCYVTGGQICSRCELRVDPDEVIMHSYPVWNATNPSSDWKLISENGNVKVYRAYCYNGCGCYIEKSTVNCVWKKTVIAPTCTEDGYTLNECTTCETPHSFNSDTVAKLGHDMPGGWSEEILPATCTEDGILRHYCSRYDDCGYYEDEPIPALGHEMTKHEAVSATCTEDGNTEYYYCGVCKKFFADEEGKTEIEQDSWIIPAFGHVGADTVEWVVTDENGCGKTGWQKKFCDREVDGVVCNCVIDEEEIPEITPKYYVVTSMTENAVLVSGDEYEGVWEPTSCVYDGIIYWTCEICEGTSKAHSRLPLVVYEPEIIGRLAHKPGDKETVEEAYCVHDGHYIVNCTRCGTTLDEGDIPAPYDKHDYKVTETIASPCTGGTDLEHYVCTRCDVTSCGSCDGTENPGPHHYWVGETAEHTVGLINSIAPTCLEEGLNVYGCTVDGCSYIDREEVVEATGHQNYQLSYTVDAKCEEGGYEVWVCQTLKRDGTVCGHEITKNHTNPLGHAPVKTDAVAPLCLVDGNFEYYTCSRGYCQKKFFDEACTNEATDTTIIDPALGDIWKDDWKSDYEDWDGKSDVTTVENPTHTRWCHRETPCSHEIEVNHQTEACTFGPWTIRVEPTVDDKGVEWRQCTVCHAYQYRYCDMLESFTVTFLAANAAGDIEVDGKMYDLVEAYRVAYGTKTVAPPSIPAVEGFTGAWDSDAYEHLEDKDVTIKAEYTEIPPSELEDEENKVVTIDGGVATITLKAQADTLNVEAPLSAEPVDVILVLDQSTSMRTNNMYVSKGKTATRFDVLKDVSKDFVAKVYENAVKYNVDHRVALVGFAGKYSGTGLLTPTGSLVQYDKKPDYANAFVDVIDNKDMLINTISGMTNSTGTSAEYGLDMAKEILSRNKDDGRKKVVLFITDGVPTRSKTFDRQVADPAIDAAWQIKNTFATPIYSIGVDAEDADPTDETKDINKFLHAVSSNYPDAADMSNLGSPAKIKGYYLAATDVSGLEEIFTGLVSKQVVTTVSFNSVTFYDTITKYYTLTTENEKALRAGLKEEYGLLDSDIIITRNDGEGEDGTTLVEIHNITPKAVKDENGNVTGYLATVSFDVTANEETIAGGVYATNTEEAGISKDGKDIINFNLPEGKELSSGRAIIKFMAGGQVYAIREVEIGDKIEAPEADNINWLIENEVVVDEVTEITAEYTSAKWPVTWTIGDKVIEEEYHVGQPINIPQVENTDSGIFSGWNAPVPYIMPDYELKFTALFTSHEHSYELSDVSGDCLTGVTEKYICGCGAVKTETDDTPEHKYTAIIQQDENESLATVTCSVCGKSESKVLNYEAAYNSDGSSSNGPNNNPNIPNTFSLNLIDRTGIEVQPDGIIYVKVYVTGNTLRAAKNDKLSVYRVNEDGSKDNIQYTVEGSYLVMELDHFSYYVLEILGNEGDDAPTDFNYNNAVCSINGHTYVPTVTAPTCTEKGYTTYLCACGVSYVDDKTDPTGHSMADGTCTVCGFKEAECGCLCHSKSGFGKFIWAIVRFFWKLFRMNPVCECQAAHY